MLNKDMTQRLTVFDCSLIQLPRTENRAGNITPVHTGVEVPFDIRRVFYLFDIPGGESRGAHAHKECHQFLVAASGAFEILLDDGRVQRQVMLNRPYMGLHIPPGIWASELNFSSGAICLVLASHGYSETDYIRSYDDYIAYVQNPY
jgi:WxcM-like, C-terminal